MRVETEQLTRRLKLPATAAAPLADYDLSKEHFLVYVPSTYDKSKPLGLIVLAIYKHAGVLKFMDASTASLKIPVAASDTQPTSRPR